MTVSRYSFHARFIAAVGGRGGASNAFTSRRDSSTFSLMTECSFNSSDAAVRACSMTNAPTDWPFKAAAFSIKRLSPEETRAKKRVSFGFALRDAVAVGMLDCTHNIRT